MQSTVNAGDTAWILTATALVLMMTPALGFFYGGMVRKKNILSTLNLSFITIGLISIQWVLIGYTLAFGTSIGGIIGGLDYFGLHGRHRRSESGSGQQPSAKRLCRLPDDVRHHHAGADHRRICRAHPLQDVSAVHAAVGDAGL